MKLLFSGHNVCDDENQHGIGRMARRVLTELLNLGHRCIVYNEHPLFDDRLEVCTNVNDHPDATWLLPANGFVGVHPTVENAVKYSDLPIFSIMYDIIPYLWKIGDADYERRLELTMEKSLELITISEFSRQDLILELGCPLPIHVIHPAVPFEPPTYTPIEPQDYFLSVGGYGQRKGHAELLQAVLDTEFQLIMTGERFYHGKIIEDLATEAVNRGLLIELGVVDDTTLIDLYQNAIALVYPTQYEGFGLPIIEAMACGCPVITSGLSGTKEAADGAAHLIEPNIRGIREAMCAMRFPSNRTPWIEKGLERVKRLDWKAVGRSYEKAIFGD